MLENNGVVQVRTFVRGWGITHTHCYFHLSRGAGRVANKIFQIIGIPLQNLLYGISFNSKAKIV